eukprot:COSAG01_NODE_3040_length_6683_cov_19.798755_6_plen_155_part_00
MEAETTWGCLRGAGAWLPRCIRVRRHAKPKNFVELSRIDLSQRVSALALGRPTSTAPPSPRRLLQMLRESSSYPVITPSRSALPCVIVWPALFACVFTLHRICGGVARRSWRVMPQPGGPRIHSCPPARPCRCWDRSKGRCCPGLLAMHGFGCQ